MSQVAHNPQDVKKHVRLYLAVFGVLLFLTVVTVGISYLHLALPIAIGLALAIATVKASLVAAFFMHLSTEKSIILVLLALAAGFFVFLLIIPSLHSI